MIATLPTQEQVDRIALDLAPDVVRIRLNIAQDWSVSVPVENSPVSAD
jgi:hypothetical protein